MAERDLTSNVIELRAILDCEDNLKQLRLEPTIRFLTAP
jgi:hypothetical protein